MKIKVLTITDCIYCDKLKTLLKDENILFEEMNVWLPENEEFFNNIIKITNNDHVPITIVGNQILAPSVNFNTIDECFDIIKHLLGKS